METELSLRLNQSKVNIRLHQICLNLNGKWSCICSAPNIEIYIPRNWLQHIFCKYCPSRDATEAICFYRHSLLKIAPRKTVQNEVLYMDYIFIFIHLSGNFQSCQWNPPHPHTNGIVRQKSLILIFPNMVTLHCNNLDLVFFLILIFQTVQNSYQQNQQSSTSYPTALSLCVPFTKRWGCIVHFRSLLCLKVHILYRTYIL